MNANQIDLKVCCWNIGSALQEKDANFRLIEDLIFEYKPDIVCFQEFPNSLELIDRIMLCGDFTEHLYYNCSQSHVSDGWEMGLCIFSKYEIADSSVFPLDMPTCRIFYNGREEFWHPKFFLKAQILLDKRRLNVFTGHSFPFYRYGLNAHDFEHIFSAVDEWILSQGKEQYIICADFNCDNAIISMPTVGSTHRDVYAGVATRPSGRKTDALVVPNDTECPVVINKSVGLDHNFLFAQLRFPTV